MNDIKQAYPKFKKYVDSYEDEVFFASYSNETYILDMLYGIGLSLDADQYMFAEGFREFLKDIKGIIESHEN